MPRCETIPKTRSAASSFLSFSVSPGEYDRAEKQLDVLGSDDVNKEMGALLYRSALRAERLRHDLFTKKEYPKPLGSSDATGGAVSGTLNGKAFQIHRRC